VFRRYDRKFIHNLLNIGYLLSQVLSFFFLLNSFDAAFQHKSSVLRFTMDTLIVKIVVGFDRGFKVILDGAIQIRGHSPRIIVSGGANTYFIGNHVIGSGLFGKSFSLSFLIVGWDIPSERDNTFAAVLGLLLLSEFVTAIFSSG
jgi:hypothetical protein